MKALLAYFRERFPIPVVLLLSTGMAMMLVGANSKFTWGWALPGNTALVALIFFMFLLRTRVTDEFKDSAHDDENYPNRPVQRGLISRKQIAWIGAVAFAIELTLVLVLWGGHSGFWGPLSYLPVLVYSWLTANEFFVGDWLNRHFNIYLVLHQLIFVFFAAWGVVVTLGDFKIRDIAGSLGFVLMMMLVEIARKYEIRLNPAGEVVKDTYLAVWGRTPSLIVVFVLSTVATALLYFQSAAEELWVGIVLMSIGLVMLRKRDSEIKLLIILNFLFQAAVVYLR